MSVTALHASQPTTPVEPPNGRKPLAQVSPNADKQLRMAADAYIRNPTTLVQDHGLALYGATMQTLNASYSISAGTGVGKPVTDYGNPLRSAATQARNTAISSTVRNTVLVVMKKQDVPTAVGNVTADIITGAGRSAASSLATNGAVFAISKAGGGSFPIVIGGIAAGMVASYATGKVMQKTGARQAIATKTTEVVRKAFGGKKQ
jgi:hypothetical protein